MKDYIRQFVVIVTTLFAITINALANILPINGLNTGEISDRFTVYFVPAGYVFAIWGVIYLGILAVMVYSALPKFRTSKLARHIGWWFSIGNIANGVWILLWHNLQFSATVVVMLILLATLMIAYTRSRPVSGMSGVEFWMVSVPFSLYLGWISVATVANVTSLLDFLNWNRFGASEEFWFVLILMVVSLLVWVLNSRFQDKFYTLVILWALAGIAVKHAGVVSVSVSTWVAFAFVIVSYFMAPRFPVGKEV